MNTTDGTQRTMGLPGATGVGVGAIVGGGILALAGVAFATTGPSAVLAFGLNGLIALLTALSFAEMASKFPESGGTYTFSKKVLSVEAAFTVGWVVWFASILAAVLYAVGFAHFSMVLGRDLWRTALGTAAPGWMSGHSNVTLVAVATTVLLAIGLMRSSGGGGQWVNVGKVAVFGFLILGGAWSVSQQTLTVSGAALRPFFSAGGSGLIQAMGYTFIALQGFDLIAAVGGQVRRPEKTIPRAMILSLAIALAIYLPLLLIISTVGAPAGQTIGEAAAKNPEGIVAVAAQNYLGAFGYWLVVVAAVLSMFSALQANLFAASHIARTMAQDRTLPTYLSRLSIRHGTPAAALFVTATIVSTLLLILPDVASAGAASSLIFLISFALAHSIAILVRRRSLLRPPPFRTAFFPMVPVVGGLFCIGLALFQGIAVPAAGLIILLWLGGGGFLFVTLFLGRARVADASATAADPELITLRGRTPLVLVPIANPRNAEALISLANALVPAGIGRVLLHTVVVAPEAWQPERDPAPFTRSQEVLAESLRAASQLGIRTEALTTVAPQAMEEIMRVASLHRCESLVLGLSEFSGTDREDPLESLLGTLDMDIVVARVPPDWRLEKATRILVAVAGAGGHENLRARMLGSLLRERPIDITYLRVVPTTVSPEEILKLERTLKRLAEDEIRGSCTIQVVQDNQPLTAVARYTQQADLLILGVQRLGRRKKLFGHFTRQIARQTSNPILVMSHRG